MSVREPEPGFSLVRVVGSLVLYGLAFGYVEGAVVVDLRALYDPIHRKLRPESASGDLFPIIRLDELRAEGHDHVRRLAVEIGREAATLVMLAAVPFAFARNFRQWIAGFMIGFGVWDLAYYATLKLVLDWPESIFTWDLLFLLPVPWSGPVLAPGLVAFSIVWAGIVILARESNAEPIRLNPLHWIAILLGGSTVIASFCWDARAVMDGAHPGPFPWWLFGLGEGMGVLAFHLACRRQVKQEVGIGSVQS